MQQEPQPPDQEAEVVADGGEHGVDGDQFDYGLLPPALFKQVRDSILALDDEKQKRVMARRD